MSATQLTVSRGRAADLGAIARQEPLTLDGLGDVLEEAHALSFGPTYEEYSALHAASAAGDKDAKRRLLSIKAAPWFVTAAFKDDRRVAANLLECSALVGDADQPGTTREHLIAKLNALGCAYVASTSTSHGCGGQARYRVVIPLATPVAAERYKALHAWLRAHMEGMLDPGAKDPTRLNYMPRVPQGAVGHEVIRHTDAPWLDPAGVPTTTTETEPQDIAEESGTVLTEITDAQLVHLKSGLRVLAPHAGSNEIWTEAGYGLLSLGDLGYKLFSDFSAEAPNGTLGAADDWWQAHSGQIPRSDFRHVLNMARKLAGWKEEPKVSDPASFPVVPIVETTPPAGRPQIRIVNGQIHQHVQQALQMLGWSIYTRAGRLVRIAAPSDPESGDDIKRSADRQRLIDVTPEWLVVELTRQADFLRFDSRKGDWVNIDCPRALAATILEQRDWPGVPALKGIQHSPFIREDASICETPGYDPISQYCYIPNAVFPRLPEGVTHEQARAAAQELQEPFSEYPFAGDAARSAYLAHILTEAARPALRTAPMFDYTAPLASTGKTALSEWAAMIVHGDPPATRPWSDSQEELRKTLFSSLLNGDRSIAIDNLPSGQKMRSAVLCSFLTSDKMQDRKLGVSEVPTVHNVAVVSASGNNITPCSDLARRSLVIRLDANQTRSELSQRIFKIPDLRRYVGEHRVALLMAALTIIRGHQQSGHRGPTPLPSFEQWSRAVRDAIIWLGMADPVDTQADETEDESANLTPIFEELGRQFAGRDFVAQDILAVVGHLMDLAQTKVAMLQAAGCSDPLDRVKIGYWLRENRDRIAGGYKLQRVESGNRHKGSARWRLKQVATGQDADVEFGDLL